MWVCVVSDYKQNTILASSTIKDKTAEEITKILNVADHYITIRTPTFRKRLDPGCIVLDEYKELVLAKRPENYPPTPFHIAMVPTTDETDIVYYINVETQMNTTFPKMPIPMTNQELQDFTIGDLLLKCQEIFSYEATNYQLLFNGESVQESDHANQWLNSTDNITFRCEVSEQAQKRIHHRIFQCHEIVNSEQTYIDNLGEIQSYWDPAIRASKLFNETQARMIFRDIPTIKNSHTVFFDSFRSEPVSFAMEFGTKFLSFVQFFKMSATFVSQFKQIDALIKDKMRNKTFATKFREIENNLPNGSGRDFLSYYVVPVQRYPRYPLLIRDLFKQTPNWHPDKIYLKEAINALDRVNKEIDHSSHRMNKLQEMDSLQKMFGTSLTIVDPQRELIAKTDIRITKPKQMQGTLFLFNDMIVVTVNNKKLVTVVTHASIAEWRFMNCRPTAENLCFIHEDKEYIVQFADRESKAAWMTPFNQFRSVALSSITKNDTGGRSFVKWTDMEVGQGVPALMGHDGCFAGKYIYFFGGINASLVESDALVRYDIAEHIWFSRAVEIPARSGHTVTYCNNAVWICFGQCQNKWIDDIWMFREGMCRGVIAIDNPFIKRIGHTTIAAGRRLFIFGGEDENGVLHNDLWVFDTEDFTFEQHVLHGAPEPRKYHSSVWIPKTNEMVIIGGRTEKNIANDVYVLALSTLTWRKEVDAVISERMYHKSYLFDRYLITFGGVNQTGNADMAVIDTMHWDVIAFEQKGNIPYGLSGFAIAAMSDKTIMTFGGTDATTRGANSCSYVLDVTDSIFARVARIRKSIRAAVHLEEPITTEEPEPKLVKEEKKPEPITTEPIKEEPITTEPIKEEPKPEPITTEPIKEEPKPEPIKEEPKPEPVKEQKKPEPTKPVPKPVIREPPRPAPKPVVREEPKKPQFTSNLKIESSFSAAKMFAELNIDTSNMLPFEKTAATMKLRRLWNIRDKNNKLQEEVEDKEQMLNGTCYLGANKSIWLKVFDDTDKKMKILKVTADSTAAEIEAHVKKCINRDALFSIVTAKTQKADLNDENLHAAHKDIFFGHIHGITIIAL